MSVTVVASRGVFEHALSVANGLGESDSIPVPGLHAPLDHIRAYLNQAWAAIDEALRCAFLHGKEQADDLFKAAFSTVHKMITQVGSGAEALQTALLEKLRAFTREMVTGAMSLMPSEYKVGDRTFVVQSVSFTQKVMLSGSLEASLERMFKLTSEGSFDIETHYTERQ